MLTVNKLLSQGHGLAPVLLKRAATVQLDWPARQQNRFSTQDSLGRALNIALADGTVLRGGDVLVAEDGSMIRVEAAPQSVLRITACSTHGKPLDLTRAAYHLAQQHAKVELQNDHLKIEPNPVLADMLRGMHLNVQEVTEPFEPEADIHASSAHHHHDDHHHAHEHGDTGHVHGPHCNHNHDHHHGHAHPTPASQVAPVRGKPIGIAVKSAPHVHGPGCGHDH